MRKDLRHGLPGVCVARPVRLFDGFDQCVIWGLTSVLFVRCLGVDQCVIYGGDQFFFDQFGIWGVGFRVQG